jgi:hypothetical protein
MFNQLPEYLHNPVALLTPHLGVYHVNNRINIILPSTNSKGEHWFVAIQPESHDGGYKVEDVGTLTTGMYLGPDHKVREFAKKYVIATGVG